MKNLVNLTCVVLLSLCTWQFLSSKDNSWSNGFNHSFGCQGCSTDDIANMYKGYIDEWKTSIAKSFDSAETKVFNKSPNPDIVGPDPDPKKCVCKGSGIIVQGDGHKTPCPYHGKGDILNLIIK